MYGQPGLQGAAGVNSRWVDRSSYLCSGSTMQTTSSSQPRQRHRMLVPQCIHIYFIIKPQRTCFKLYHLKQEVVSTCPNAFILSHFHQKNKYNGMQFQGQLSPQSFVTQNNDIFVCFNVLITQWVTGPFLTIH